MDRWLGRGFGNMLTRLFPLLPTLAFAPTMVKQILTYLAIGIKDASASSG